ncbi:MAG: YncE family protein [Terriglobales bacterium]
MTKLCSFLFAVIVIGGAIVLGITVNLEGPGILRGMVNESTTLASAPLLRRTATIEVPGPAGKRFDYAVIDPSKHLLFSTHLAANQLYVIRLPDNKVVKTVPNLPGIEAVELVPQMNQAYTSDWWENKIGIIDLESLAIIKKLPTEDKPDGIAYAADFHKIYVSDERAKAEAVIDVTKDEIVTTLHFDSETGMPQYDPVTRRIYVNLQDRDELVEIDPGSDTIAARYPVARCRGNHGMALDPEHRRAFLSCEGNDQMIVFDLQTHATIAALPMARGADVIKFDPGTRRIYVACGSGAISIFQQEDADHYRKLGDAPVAEKVHSLAIDPATHRIYAPEEQENGRAVARIAVYEPVLAR